MTTTVRCATAKTVTSGVTTANAGTPTTPPSGQIGCRIKPKSPALFWTRSNPERGEPGIFNRRAAIENRPARRQIADFGTNPCGEIILRPYQFCNLSSAVSREDDTFETLKEKVEAAAIIGTLQSLATHFPVRALFGATTAPKNGLV